MTTKQKNSRADTVRKRRSSRNSLKTVSKIPGTGVRQTSRTSRQSYRPDSIVLPVESHTGLVTARRMTKTGAIRKAQGNTLRQSFVVSSPTNTHPQSGGTRRSGKRTNGNLGRHAKYDAQNEGYNFTFSLGRTAVRAPLLNLPNLGTRWVSAGLTLLLVMLIYTMATANLFKVSAIELSGNQRLAPEDVNTQLGLDGQLIFKVLPSQVEDELRTAFPDLEAASVQIGFPNRILVSVVERTPILAWYQDSNITWIDANGIAFTPRGDVPGLIQIASNGTPPKPAVDAQPDQKGRGQKSINDQAFISPAMVQAIQMLAPQIPQGTPMIYDPKYGIGWQDPRGWSVYFGQDTKDVEVKKVVYQAIVDTFAKQGIQPTLISVAYLAAPFYK